MINQEEAFILQSSEKRRILIDLYETNLSNILIDKFVQHILRISPRIVKLAISSDKKSLRQLKKAILKSTSLATQQLCFCTDMEEAKTWLISD